MRSSWWRVTQPAEASTRKCSAWGMAGGYMAQTRPSPTLSRGFTRLGRFLAPYAVLGSVSRVLSGGCHAVRVRSARDRSGPRLEDLSSWTPGPVPLLPGVGLARPVQSARVSVTAGPRRAAQALVLSSRVPVMFFVFVPVESSFPSRPFADFGVAWCEPARGGPASRRRPVSWSTYTAAGDDTVGLYLVQPIGRWR